LVQLVPQPGQYLIYDASEKSTVELHQIRKDVGIGSGDWTVEMDMRIADLIRTSPASAADRWFGFVVEIFANGKRWRVNWSDDNQISLLGVASYLELPPSLSHDFHTYTLHYDGNGVLSVGVDGVLLGTLNSAGITADVADGIQIISAHGQWEGGTTEVYLDRIGLYKFRENSLRIVAELPVTAVNNGNEQAQISFPIQSANGRGYAVYLSESGARGSFSRYDDVNYNAKGVHIKKLTNDKTYYVYITYEENGVVTMQSAVTKLKPLPQ